jgi:hypothetical protein
MINSRRSSKGGSALLLAGAAAAFAYYKYSKMSPEQRDSLVGNLKEQGKKLYEQYVPQDVKEMFANKGGDMGSTGSTGTTGSETNSYSS